jgi:glyceraldehyde 3-phosphate dehydrogenase
MKIAIKGFGRIGRQILRLGLSPNEKRLFQFVAINDRSSKEIGAYLFKYDSVHPVFPERVSVERDSIKIGRHTIRVLSETELSRLPWRDLKVDLVMECTGKFTAKVFAEKHLENGAKKVLVSAPCKDDDITIVMGVNEKEYDAKKHYVISNASCTTNCVSVIAKVLRDHLGLERAFMTTVHAYTNDQPVLDNTHHDFRRARAAALSMIPTTSGASRSMAKIFPELKGAFEGLSIRVPTPDVSLIDLVAEVKKPVTVKSLNDIFKEEAYGKLKRYLGYIEEPLVSSDFIGDERSAVIDAPLTQVLGGRFIKVIAWYDNEVGFSARMLDLAEYIGGH